MKITVRFILFFMLVICLCAAARLLFFKNKPEAADSPVYLDNNFDGKVADAIDRYRDTGEAKTVTGIKTDKNVLVLAFAGMAETDTMTELIGIVKKYGLKSVFFLPGTEVAEYERTAADIRNIGSKAESYSLYGEKHMEKLLPYEMIDDFVYSYELIKRGGKNQAPRYLMCNNTLYTNELLRAAKAGGYEGVVEPGALLNFQSFSDYAMAFGYVKRLPNGSILTIKTDGVLDIDEYELPGKTQDVGKEAALGQNETFAPLDEKERLLNVTEWVCRAVSAQKRETADIDGLLAIAAGAGS